MKEEKVKEKMFIQNNKSLKLSPKGKKRINLEFFETDKEKKSEEKTKTKKNKIVKLSPEVVKKINYKEFFVKDKVKKEQKNNSNSPTNTTSSSPSSNLTANNSGNPIISVQTDKKNGDWILTSCHEINISFINKK